MAAIVVADVDEGGAAVNRVVSLARSRRFAVRSWTIAQSHAPDVTRIVMTVDSPSNVVQRFVECVAKLADVRNVTALDPAASVVREIALVRLECGSDHQGLFISQLPDECRVLDRTDTRLVLEATAAPGRLDDILKQLEPMIVDFVRPGTVAISTAHL